MVLNFTRIFFAAVAVVVLSFSLTLPLPAQSPSVSRLLDSVSQAHLAGHIQTLARAGGHYNRVSYTPGNDSAVAYIYDSFRRIPGLTSVRLDTFLVSQATTPYNTRPLFNVVANLGGRAEPGKQILLGAHLDCSASRDSTGAWTAQWATMRVPGADDNATGVAVILELARLLATPAFGCLNDYTVTFVAFGAEESTPPYAGKISHPGSKHYAATAKARGDQILAMMSIDMIGYNRQYDYTNIVANTASQSIGATITTANQLYSIGLLTNASPFASATFSDHAEFWTNGYPAICLIENNAPWNSHTYYAASPLYHTSADTFETLNMPLVRKVAQAVLGAVVSLAQVTVTGVAGPAADGPTVATLDQNYPNPFNGQTVIRYQLPDQALSGGSGLAHVRLTVHDMLGREVAVLKDRPEGPGVYSVPFNATGFASGVYVYRLHVRPSAASGGSAVSARTQEFSSARRLVLVR